MCSAAGGRSQAVAPPDHSSLLSVDSLCSPCSHLTTPPVDSCGRRFSGCNLDRIGTAAMFRSPPALLLVSSLLLSTLSFINARPFEKRQQAIPQKPKQGANGIVVNNGLGQAHGVLDGAAYRFAVKYAQAPRFGLPVQSTSWINLSDPSAMPPVCPQDGYDSTQMSEDCLWAVIYAPAALLTGSRAATVPVYVWIHGGSSVEGSASNPGLDGSNLAVATNSIVVVLQYRLGVLGWLPPTSGPVPAGNLGLQDVITCLSFINNVISFFGGSAPVTIGGHSSGGTIVRALLGSPKASQYFRAATIHADPMGYGLMKNSIYQELQSTFYSTSSLGSCSTISPTSSPKYLSCLQQLDIPTILSQQDNFINYGTAYLLDPSVGSGEPIRPHVDGSLVTSSLTTSYPSVKKPLLITSNRDDAGQAIGGYYPADWDISNFAPTVEGSLGQQRSNVLLPSPYYNPDPSLSPPLVQPYINNGDQTRQALSRLGTDQLWRCADWDFAKRWAANGGAAYTATFEAGATYPDNQGIPFCNGMVCHEDEIYIIFGTAPNPTPSQSALIAQVQARLKAFFDNPSVAPNPSSSYGKWTAATSSNANAIQLGGSQDGQPVTPYACVNGFWGQSVPFEWQLNGE